MENLWLLYAIIASLCGSIGWFTVHYAADRKVDKDLFIMHSFLIGLIVYGILFLFKEVTFSYLPVLLGLLFGVGEYYIRKISILAFQEVSVSFFLINQRIWASISVLIVGYYYFKESLTSVQLFSFFLGFLVFYTLLSDEKKNNKKDSLRKGLIYLIPVVIFPTLVHSVIKIISTSQGNSFMLFFLSWFFSTTLVAYFFSKRNNNKISLSKNNYILAAISGLCMVTFFYTSPIAYQTGLFALVYKIISYSIMGTIFLSAYFLNEKISKVQYVGIFLTIVSIWLFV